MRAKVRLFARLSELAGTRAVEVELGEGVSAGDVYALLCRDYEQLTGLGDIIRFAVNGEYVSSDHPVAENDEVALIPPVSGGAGAV